MDFWYKKNPRMPDGLVSEEFLKAYMGFLFKACSRETSADPNRWTAENPLYGHCAVVALCVQDEFGGSLLRASLEGVSGYEHMRSHYWNLLDNDMEVDLSASQFNGNARELVPGGERRTREYVFSNVDTKRRYEILRKRVRNFHKEWARRDL